MGKQAEEKPEAPKVVVCEDILAKRADKYKGAKPDEPHPIDLIK